MLKVIFEFIGGPNDGRVLNGALGDASDAERYYLFTNHGTIGQRLKVASEYAVETLAEEQLKEEKPHCFQPHYYIVTERLEEDDEVLVRTEYVEMEAEKSSRSLVKEHLEPSSVATESADERIQQFLELAVRSMAGSYSHYWPSAPEPNLALHFGHVLLDQNFSVFAAANQKEKASQQADVVGISPNQDWFLACRFKQLHDTDALGELLDEVNRLESFWLTSELTIPACAKHIVRVAEHCQAGFGVVAGIHWVPEGSEGTKLLTFWTTLEGDDTVLIDFSEKLEELDAHWPEPISVQEFAGQGTCYLLAAFFRIPAS